MLSIDDEAFENLAKIAEARHITIQDLLRAVIIPEWYAGRSHGGDKIDGTRMSD